MELREGQRPSGGAVYCHRLRLVHPIINFRSGRGRRGLGWVIARIARIAPPKRKSGRVPGKKKYRLSVPAVKRRFEEQFHRRRAPRRVGLFDAASIEARTVFPTRVKPPSSTPRVLKSGEHNRKIGDRVIKGRWKGMPVYTLTLEERKTCPRNCKEWLNCYGNNMQFSVRLQHGPELERRLEEELCTLASLHTKGFVVRLHVLGDFYSIAYVLKWLGWVRRLPALRVYGYSAHQRGTPIGDLIWNMSKNMWDRFAVRTSGGTGPRTTAVRIVPAADDLVCPVQIGKTACCGTCALCWQTQKPIIFLEH